MMADENDDDPFGDVQDDLCDAPLEVSVLKNAIILTGPDGVALAMTVNAVEASIGRLQEAVISVTQPLRQT